MDAASPLPAGHVVGTWTWDVRKNRVYAGERLASFYGLTGQQGRSGLPIEHYTKAIDPRDRERVVRAISLPIQTGSPFDVEYRLHTLHDGVRLVRAIGECFHDFTFRPLLYSGYALDITARGDPDVEGDGITALLAAAAAKADDKGSKYLRYVIEMAINEVAGNP